MADVPTIDEAGVKGYASNLWLGLLATPKVRRPEIINRLYEEIARLLRQPDVESIYLATGTDVTITTPEQFGQFIKAEYEKWATVI
jgi:tripartite-type tricarboxylate transporter receptor subunit TctC